MSDSSNDVVVRTNENMVMSDSKLRFAIDQLQEISMNPTDRNLNELIDVLKKLPVIIITIFVFLKRFIESLISGGRGGSKKIRKSRKSKK